MTRTRAGQTLVEYGLLLILIATIVLTALLFLGPIVNDIVDAKVTVDDKAYAARHANTITVEGDLYVAADTECLAIEGKTITVNDAEYVRVGPGDTIEYQGYTLFRVDPDCGTE